MTDFPGAVSPPPTDQLRLLLGERTSVLRRLAAYASFGLTGIWPADDPWPDGIDDLCDQLATMGRARQEETP